MTARPLPRRPVLLSAFAALLAACSIDHASAPVIPLDGATAVDMTTVPTNDAEVSVDGGRGKPFHVLLTSDVPNGRICRGSCVLLSVRAEQGVPPYRYTFDQGLPAGAEVQRVCPTETTTYQVSASDSSFDGEFGGKNAPVSSSLTVTVDSCVDGSMPSAGDAGANDASIARPIDPPLRDSGIGPSGTVACQTTIATAARSGASSGWFEAGNYLFKHTIVSSVDGAAYFVARYTGTIALNDGTRYSTTAPPHATALLVGKLSPDCQLLWTKNLTGAGSAGVGRLATDSKGRLVVMSQTQRLDHQEVWNLALTVLAPDGTLVWEKVLGAVTGGVGTLQTDANDDIVLASGALAGADFGGGPIGKYTPTSSTVVVLAKYTSAGVHLWSKLVQEELAIPTLAISGKSTILLHARSTTPLDWGAAGRTGSTQPSSTHGYLVAADGGGNFLWSRVVGDSVGNPQFGFDQVDVNAAGQLVMSQFPVVGELTVGSVDGTSLSWERRVVSAGASDPSTIWHKTHCDAFGNTFVAGLFTSELSQEGTSPRAPSGLGYVQKIGPEGGLRWTYAPPLSDLSVPLEILGVTSDGQGGALLLTTPRDDYQYEIDAIRLFP